MVAASAKQGTSTTWFVMTRVLRIRAADVFCCLFSLSLPHKKSTVSRGVS
jgi:hypothetical protein